MTSARFTLLVAILIWTAPLATAVEPTLNVDRMVEEALQNNPEILAAREKAAAVREKVPQAGALDDPMLGLGIVNLPTNFSFSDEDMTMKEVSVSQKVPFPGKRDLMRGMTEKEADAASIDVAEVANRVAREVKTAYYELSHTYSAEEVTRRNKQILENLVRIGETRYALGEGIQQEVLAAHLEISRMVDELLMLEQSRAALEAKLAWLLNREVDGVSGRPETVVFHKAAIDIKRLQQAAIEANPMLKGLRKMVEAREKGKELAERDVLPDFDFRFAYGQRDDGPGGADRRDLMTGMVGISIPIYYPLKQGPKVAESRADVRSAEARYRAARNEVLYMVASMGAMVQRLERQIELYQTGILPQARLQAQSTMSSYAVNKVDFNGLLESHIRLHRFELDYHQALTDYEKSLAALEASVGQPLRPQEVGK